MNMDKGLILSDLTIKLNWMQKNTSYILAGIFESKEKPNECIVLVIPGIHELIEGDNLIEKEYDTEIGQIKVLDVRSLKWYYGGSFFIIDSLNNEKRIIINGFLNHLLKAYEEYKKSSKSIKDMQNTERKIKNIIHQMIYDDVLKRDMIAYQMTKTKNNNQNIRK